MPTCYSGNTSQMPPAAYGPEIQAIDDLSHPAFADNSNAVDVPVKAGDLIILDARLIHATWPNQTDQRHTLLLGPVNIHAKQMMVHTKLSIDMKLGSGFS